MKFLLEMDTIDMVTQVSFISNFEATKFTG